MLANQWLHYCVSSPTQRAVANIIQAADKPYTHNTTVYNNYYDYVCTEYQRKRDDLVLSLIVRPIVPDGGFFIMADTTSHKVPQEYYMNAPGLNGKVPVTRDWAFARYCAVNIELYV